MKRHDGSFLEPKTKLRAGELLIVDLARPVNLSLKPFAYDLTLQEDKDILVINKPQVWLHPGMVLTSAL